MHTIANQQTIEGRNLIADTFEEVGTHIVSAADIANIFEKARQEYNSLNPTDDHKRRFEPRKPHAKAGVERFLLHIRQATDGLRSRSAGNRRSQAPDHSPTNHEDA